MDMPFWNSVTPPAPGEVPPSLPPAAGGVPPTVPVPAQPAEATPNQPDSVDFFTKLRTDPAMAQAMMMMGARLMQGPHAGQNQLGAFGDAAMLGLTAHNMMKENIRNQGIQEQELAMRQAESGAKVGHLQAQTGYLGAQQAEAEQKTAQEKELFPETKKKVAAEIRRLSAAGDVASAQALREQYRSDPKRLAQEWNLDMGRIQAATNASNAAAGASSAHAENTRQRTKAGEKLLEEGDLETVYTGHQATSGARGAQAKLAELKTYLQAAYPEMTEQELAQEMLKIQTDKKGGRTEALVKLQDSEDKAIRQWATEQLAAEAGYGKGPKGGKPAPAPGVELPPGVTMEDVRHTAKLRGLTEQQVLDALKKGK